jgi:hypothetical protein
MRILTTMLATIALAVVALVASPATLAATTTSTPLDCYQFGSYEEAQAASEVDQASFSPTLTYLDDDGDGLICECFYYEEICWLPSSEPPTRPFPCRVRLAPRTPCRRASGPWSCSTSCASNPSDPGRADA